MLALAQRRHATATTAIFRRRPFCIEVTAALLASLRITVRPCVFEGHYHPFRLLATVTLCSNSISDIDPRVNGKLLISVTFASHANRMPFVTHPL